MVVKLPDALIVSRANELKSLLLSALDQCEPVELDGRGVDEVDLAGLQVLCAARRSALARGRSLTLTPARRSAVLQDAFGLTGLGDVSCDAWDHEEDRHG
jgi:anti-anti-sigma regulatory factor